VSRVHREDRGLAAVARVRAVREQDSRIGLQMASADAAAKEAVATRLHDRLATAELPAAASPGQLAARRTSLVLLGGETRVARDRAGAAARITDEARTHWSADRARVAAVEHLLAARAERRRTDLARKAAAEADDLAAQAWLRRRTDEHEEES